MSWRTGMMPLAAVGLVVGSGAVILGGSGAAFSQFDEPNRTATQGFEVEVDAGELRIVTSGCSRSRPQVDFGTLARGERASKGTYGFCVRNTTGETADVFSRVLTSASTGSRQLLPASALTLKVLSGSASSACIDFCSMSATNRLTFAVQSRDETRILDYALRLTVPSSQAGGRYTGGVLQHTLMARDNDPRPPEPLP